MFSGGIHLSETKRRFMEGTLHPANVLMCPHTCITNLPKPREVHPDVGNKSKHLNPLEQILSKKFTLRSCICDSWKSSPGKSSRLCYWP
jgi:hypothetical protein